MHRRQLLVNLSLGLAVLTAGPRSAWAIGGILPSLDAPAPDFDLTGIAPSPDGDPQPTRISLGDRRGLWTVVYFYPRDFTSGCTLEARGFQHDLADLHRCGAEVIGISADDADRHAEFCGSEGLHYPLLSDPDGLVSRRYGSWIAPFSQRHTFLIDTQGLIKARWVNVKPAGHSQEVLMELRRLRAVARSADPA